MSHHFRFPRPLMGLAAALALALAPAAWAANVPAGSVITGSVSGASTGLLGFDTGYGGGAGSNVTALTDGDIEFLTDDFAVAIDFFSDGLVRIYDNTGTGMIAGNYSFSFDFAALPAAFTSFGISDASGLTGGNVSVSRVDGDTLTVSLDNAAFSSAFGSFTAQIQTAAVPEPGSLALAAAALALLTASSRRNRTGGRS